MFFQHVYDKTLAQASYFIGCQKAGVAAVIDPKRDIDTYLEIARTQNMQITHVLETHIHADFLSGSRELAALTGAKMYLSDEGGPDWQYQFEHVGLKDGDEFKVGNLLFKVLHTPGHTPESISFLLTDLPATDQPVMLFTGDFVFVGDVGRPDLLEKAAGIKGTQDLGAKQMYQSLQKFNALPDYIQVWPGHGAGSACGKALGAVPSTTVGYEKIRNWAFKFSSNPDAFVQNLLTDQPEPPKYFAMMKHLNKVERPLLTQIPEVKKLTPKEVKEALNKGLQIIDTRNKASFAKSFIKGTLNIQNNNAFANWCGWYLSYNETFLLIADDSELENITRKLMRIGLDNILGYSNFEELEESGLFELDQVKQIDINALKSMVEQEDVDIIDLRNANEYKSGHIAQAKHVFVGTLTENLHQINAAKKTIIHCQGGDRASIGYSILAKHGFNNILNYSPGINEWTKMGNEVVV